MGNGTEKCSVESEEADLDINRQLFSIKSIFLGV